ncbi:MAG: hypothetical protein OHK93_002179 [Ramalina farinacea]|uniref:Uncharacterized protein n=1 Tax=Ramalina farinacea TaxID=258253 RepID=A0AA43QSM7_9LECA|nr:hypothetical protein [Ramalina farinacea]
MADQKEISPNPKPSTCHLLALPAELRLQIYSLALTASFDVSPQPAYNAVFVGTVDTDLLLTCRQIHAEARTIPFAVNRFYFYEWYDSSTYNVKRFLSALQPWQRACLKRLEFTVVEEELAEWRCQTLEDVLRLLQDSRVAKLRVRMRGPGQRHWVVEAEGKDVLAKYLYARGTERMQRIYGAGEAQVLETLGLGLVV